MRTVLAWAVSLLWLPFAVACNTLGVLGDWADKLNRIVTRWIRLKVMGK
jgi:hypothetical protein